MKRCTKCGGEKPETEFYRKTAQRLSGKCKRCHMDSVRAYRASHLEYFRQMDKRRSMLPHRVSAREKWETAHPERSSARRIVDKAVKRGDLVKLPCIVCGLAKTEGHHTHYDEPLDVVWLCRAHHKQTHAMARSAGA